MARKFTAEEMRELADEFALVNDEYHSKASEMLLQAAYIMEHKDELEKKYEYSVKEFGGYIQPLHEESVSLSFLDGRVIGDENYVIVRRSVGEWEVVE